MKFSRSLGVFSFLTFTLASVGCSSLTGDDEGGADPAPHSDRGGIGLRTLTQEVVSPSQVINARRSLAVTETAILAQFPLSAVMNQLAAQNGNPAFTGTQLFRQLWETQNAAAGPQTLDLQPSAHCSDAGTTLNGFANVCRPTEGGQASSANAAANLAAYAAIGLFNRFDLAPADGANCGEYRVVYGRTSGGRSFIIFEAVLPNPRLELGLEGCRQVQAFWRDLSNNPDINARAAALRNFYFNGLPGYQPVIHIENYGFNFASAGQIRVNMFMGGPWDLKEHKLMKQCPGGTCVLKMVPASVKTNPFGDLFNPASPHPLAASFRAHFLTQVATLANADVNRFNYEVPDQFNAAHSDAQSGGVEDDYVANLGGASTFRNDIQAQLTAIGSALTPTNIVARAQALSCGGCHQRNSGSNLGGGMIFPNSASFVHSSEFTQAGPDGTRFALSSALDNTFLPFRKNIVEEYLSAVHPVTTITRFNMVGSAADAQNAYWVENRPSGSVVRASLNSGGEQAIAFNRPNPTAVATDGVNAYWIEGGGAIQRVSINGGAITTLATGIAGLGGIATDGVNVYFTRGGTTIARLPVGGGAITTVVTGRVGLTGKLAVDATNLLWQEGNNIQRAPKAAGTPISTFLNRPSIVGIASDGTNLYLAEATVPGNVLRASLAGGLPTVLFAGAFNISSIAVGATNFVWTSDSNPGPVMTKVKD